MGALPWNPRVMRGGLPGQSRTLQACPPPCPYKTCRYTSRRCRGCVWRLDLMVRHRCCCPRGHLFQVSM